MQPRKLLPLLILSVTLLFAVIIWFYPPSSDFTVGNPFWNGLQTFSSQTKTTTLTSYDNLPTNPKGTTTIVIPYEPFTTTELSQLQKYISNGGTLLLLDDYGYGNQVLNSLGLNVRFTGTPLLDPLYDYNNKWLPKITDFKATSVGGNLSSIVLNHATSLNQTTGTTVIAQSSVFSFLDLNSNGEWDTDEPNGPFPEMAYTKVGQGYIVLVADPSILINSMINLDDNQQFITNAINIQTTNSQVYIDQKHLPATSLDEAKTTLTIVYNVIASPAGTICLIAVLLTVTFYPILRVKKYDTTT
ncbi:MAG: DUF4350 domain-containing protein [Candidatus Bathyarchaeota archaeon]|nr:DUF4350 domain-containing protein [Candidatus Bathyarchaeota archaeon]